MGDLVLPRGSLAYATVTDPDGEPVADAEIHVWVLSSDSGVCANVHNAPCVPPARQRALVKTDATGHATIALPSP